MPEREPITLQTPLDLRTSFAFPLQSARSRREVLIGAALLLIPFVGWLLNMGHRVMMVHRMLHGEPAWPSWRNFGELLRHGLVTFGGMVFYPDPAVKKRAPSGSSSLEETSGKKDLPGHFTQTVLG